MCLGIKIIESERKRNEWTGEETREAAWCEQGRA